MCNSFSLYPRVFSSVLNQKENENGIAAALNQNW